MHYFEWNFGINSIYFTILHSACKSDNFDLIKYITSLDDIDTNAKTISFSILF